MWFEYGETVNIFGGSWYQDSLDYAKQDNYYRNFSRMVSESKTNGSFSWLWAGGYRTGENSDMGLTEPFGAPRPALNTLASALPKMKTDAPYTSPTLKMTIDRDSDVRGMAAISAAAKADFLNYERQGYNPIMETAGSGHSTADMPLAGIGNVPFQQGRPAKYLNAEFVKVEVALSDGSWKTIRRGGEFRFGEVTRPCRMRASAINTDDVIWNSGQLNGGQVKLRLYKEPKEVMAEAPIGANVAWGNSATVELTFPAPITTATAVSLHLRFATDRAGDFGETFHLSASMNMATPTPTPHATPVPQTLFSDTFENANIGSAISGRTLNNGLGGNRLKKWRADDHRLGWETTVQLLPNSGEKWARINDWWNDISDPGVIVGRDYLFEALLHPYPSMSRMGVEMNEGLSPDLCETSILNQPRPRFSIAVIWHDHYAIGILSGPAADPKIRDRRQQGRGAPGRRPHERHDACRCGKRLRCQRQSSDSNPLHACRSQYR